MEWPAAAHRQRLIEAVRDALPAAHLVFNNGNDSPDPPQRHHPAGRRGSGSLIPTARGGLVEVAVRLDDDLAIAELPDLAIWQLLVIDLQRRRTVRPGA